MALSAFLLAGLVLASTGLDFITYSGNAVFVNGSEVVNGSSGVPPAGYAPVRAAQTVGRQMTPMGMAAGGSTKALIIEDYYPWGVRANEMALEEQGVPYDVINTDMIASTDLTRYGVVIIASDQATQSYDRLVSNRDRLASYVSGGGVLVAHAADIGHSEGWWDDSFLPLGVTHHSMYYDNNLWVWDYGSPVVSGFSSSQLNGWYYSAHGYFTGVPDSANSIISVRADDTDQWYHPTYIEYSYGSGTVLATMNSIEWPWNPYSGLNQAGLPAHYKDLLRNELRYALTLVKVTALPDLAITADDITFEKVA